MPNVKIRLITQDIGDIMQPVIADVHLSNYRQTVEFIDAEDIPGLTLGRR